MKAILNHMIIVFCIYVSFIYHTSGDEAALSAQDNSSIVITWSFNSSLEGWAQSTQAEMNAAVSISGGVLHGVVLGPLPCIDSPPLLIPALGKHYIIIRMMFSGLCTKSRIIIRPGAVPPNREMPFDSTMVQLDFDIIPDGNFHIYYLPLWKQFAGVITQIRWYPGIAASNSLAPTTGNAFELDWMTIAQAPTIQKVRGCIDQYYSTSNYISPHINVFINEQQTNGFQSVYQTISFPMDLPYASTYNCLQSGGERITIDGINFGSSGMFVYINGAPCQNVVVTAPESQIQCQSPPGVGLNVNVTIVNAMFQGLWDTANHLSYAVAAPRVDLPVISNVATHSMDLNWNPPGSFWDVITITGYQIQWKESNQVSFQNTMFVGNVTTTTIFPLASQTGYQFQIAAVVESQNSNWMILNTYGRRSIIPGAVIGQYSEMTNVTFTLSEDFKFEYFDANSTLNHSALNPVSTLGPTGNVGGEGHYGLYVVGAANIENCNVSFVCCDGFGSIDGCNAAACTTAGWSGASSSNRAAITNAPGYNDYVKVSIGNASTFPFSPTIACGPALRLTTTGAGLNGAAWYPRQMDVREGFETIFTFRISNPSLQCISMDDVYTNCRSRGGDGFAFVIQNEAEIAIGDSGMSLSYGGIGNSLAIEFDTWYNYELLDPYENHISVHTRGWRDENSANHSYSLGSSVRIPDLTDGIHTVRIVYNPILEESIVFSGVFQSNSHSGHFFSNADYPNGGQADWGTGVGSLAIYLDDLVYPILAVPIKLDTTLNLNNGRAWVGFTAGTGNHAWQVHDILSWKYTSTRNDVLSNYLPPFIVNGQGAFTCVDPLVCVHP